MFLVTNIQNDSMKQKAGFYWAGASVQERGDAVVISKSANSYNSFDPELANFEVGRSPLEKYDATFVLGKFDSATGAFRIQTDIIGFEPCFFYQRDGKYAFSSSPDALLTFLKDHGVTLSLSERKVRDLLYWGANFSDETVVDGIRKMTGGTVLTLGPDGALQMETIDTLDVKEEVTDAKVAAQNLFDIIDQGFKRKIKPGTKYGLGLSGGLDSRVAGYFAKRAGADVSPYFVGDKTGSIGQYTYDAKRSMELEKALGLPGVRFVNPLGVTWDEKIQNDLKNATLMSSNAHINAGYEFGDFDVILNGAMGGELFGACIPGNVAEMTEEDVAEYLLKYVVLLPKEKFPNNILAKILYRKNVFVEALTVPPTLYRELMPDAQLADAKNRMLEWVKGLKRQGLSNVKIIQMDLYHRYARNHYYGYFYGFNATKPVVPVYLVPSVIREMLTWKSDLFIGKKVQTEFLKMLSGLSEIRSQTTDPAVKSASYASVRKLIFGLERVFRGGGMNYRRWVLEKGFERVENDHLGELAELRMQSPYWKNAPILRLTAVKMALLKKRYGIDRCI